MPPTTGARPPGRRELKPPPKLTGKLLADAIRIQDDFNAEICRTYQGSPVLHGWTHGVGRDDPLPTPLILPKLVLAGTTPAIGVGPSYMREDAQLVASTGVPVMIGMANAEGGGTTLARAAHVHATPLTTKGDLLTVITGALGRVGVGADTFVLTADSAVAAGIKWAAAAGGTHNWLSATHPDTVPASPVRGDIPIANSTPAWTKLAIGAAGRYLRSNATDPSWSQLDVGDAALGVLALARGGTGADLSATGGSGFVIKQSSVGANLTSAALLDADIPSVLSANARVTVRKNTGADVGTRRRLNLIEGTNITLTVADDAGSEEIDITINSSGGGGAPVGASYIVVALDGTLTSERRLQGTVNQIILTDGGANADLVLSTPQDIHTAATPQFARMGIGVAADATIGLVVQDARNDNFAYEMLTLRRKRADATPPGAPGFGGYISWRLEGFTNDSDVFAAYIRSTWENAQGNDTTDRNSDMQFTTMNQNNLLTRLRITSQGSILLAPTGALSTVATDGFTYIPSCPGPPTGVPTAFAGMVPLVYDDVNFVLYGYAGGEWRGH